MIKILKNNFKKGMGIESKKLHKQVREWKQVEDETQLFLLNET